ncbi:MAG: ABC transporter permease subunit [Chloroflexales bacterium]|nr:ABC transporter permease subunit [Chloroflexales bacterium]
MLNANPVLLRELRTQLRGVRATALISTFVGLLIVMLVFMYRSIAERATLGTPLLNAQIGQALFAGLALLLQALVVFIAPAVTVSSISGEHEQRTLDFVLMTPVLGWQVLMGKLLGALAYLLVLLCSVVPLFSVVLLFGGVRPIDLGRAALVVLATGAFGVVFGLFCSALLRRTASATILCYTLLVALVGGTIFAASFWSVTHSQRPAPPAFVYANPLSAMASVLALSPSPAASGQQDALQVAAVSPGVLRPLALVDIFAQGTRIASPQGGFETIPTFRATLVLLAVAGLLLFWATSRLIDRRRGWRPGVADGALLALLLLTIAVAYAQRGWWLILPWGVIGA